MHNGNFNLTVSASLIKDLGFLVGSIPFEIAEVKYDIAQVNRNRVIYSLMNNLLSNHSNAYASPRRIWTSLRVPR